MTSKDPTRRELLRWGALGAASALMPEALAEGPRKPRGKAQACIFLWLGGGAAHIDTFDPKRRGDGRKKPGSYYDAIPTAIPGERVGEHLKRVADRLDRCVLVRSLHHKVVDEHAAATNLLHTGRPVSGTVAYPSLGSIVAHEREAEGGVPAYVVIGYPNVSRGPGFLGSKYGYVYLTDTDTGPNGLAPSAGIAPDRRSRREALLEGLRSDFEARNPDDSLVRDYASAGPASPPRSGRRMAASSAGAASSPGGWSSGACGSSRCRTT
jgi:hypothetical protein